MMPVTRLATPVASAGAIAPGAAAPVRVIICDDSLVIRSAIGRMLDSDPGITVVARVANGRAAIEQLALTSAEVMVLDIEMPVMDGLAALPLLLRADPQLRIIMASTLTTRGADIALRALRMGAADYLPKPSAVSVAADETFRQELIEKVKGLALLRRRRTASVGAPEGVSAPAGPSRMLAFRPAAARPARLLAIGSSTGGPQALFELVQGLAGMARVPVVVTQHMPAAFTAILAVHLDRLGALPCREAADGEPLRPGHIHVAPGGRHLLVEATPAGLRARLSDDPPENYCRPSVDPMLRSAAAACSGQVLVAMLTGMGQDGLVGTREVIAAGGTAIAQDEATSVVWGMPGAIARDGLCHAVLPLPRMAAKLQDLLAAPGSSAGAASTGDIPSGYRVTPEPIGTGR
jgi:two-component system chemotaxis response regulator CheB